MRKKEQAKRNEPERPSLDPVCHEQSIGDLMEYNRQYAMARRILLDDAVCPADMLAGMTDQDVESALQENYVLLGCNESSKIIRMVRRQDIPKLRGILRELRG